MKKYILGKGNKNKSMVEGVIEVYLRISNIEVFFKYKRFLGYFFLFWFVVYLCCFKNSYFCFGLVF